MIQRLITSLVLAPLVILAILYLQTPYVAAIAAALFLGGLWEWSHLVGIRSKVWRAAYLMANCLLITGLLWAHAVALMPMISLMGVAWWLLAVLWLFLRPDLGREGGTLARAVKLVAGTLAIVPAWCSLVLLHHGQGPDNHFDPMGPRWTLMALVIVWAADSCAYVVGSNLGKRKLVPHISPGKTWMGLWGGLAGGLAVGLLGMRWLGVKPDHWQAMAELTLVTVVASVVGDLFESLMKRHSGLKDSGTLFPGHGGVLDRVDSLLAALPVLWIAKGFLEL